MSLSWWNCWAETKLSTYVTLVFIFPFACGARIFQGHGNLLISVISLSRQTVFWTAQFVCHLPKLWAGGYKGIWHLVHSNSLMLLWRLLSLTPWSVIDIYQRFGRTCYLNCPRNAGSTLFGVDSKYASHHKYHPEDGSKNPSKLCKYQT
jgi:hypothetical protein